MSSLVISSKAPKLVQTLHHLLPSSQIIKTLQNRAKKNINKNKAKNTKKSQIQNQERGPKSLSPIRSGTVCQIQFRFLSFSQRFISQIFKLFAIFIDSFFCTLIVSDFRDLGSSFRC